MAKLKIATMKKPTLAALAIVIVPPVICAKKNAKSATGKLIANTMTDGSATNEDHRNRDLGIPYL